MKIHYPNESSEYRQARDALAVEEEEGSAEIADDEIEIPV